MMTGFDYASTTSAFIDELSTALTNNIGIILVFAVSIMVWVIFKKWIFGGSRRI